MMEQIKAVDPRSTVEVHLPADEDAGLDEIERTVLSMVPDPQYPHDPFILARRRYMKPGK